MEDSESKLPQSVASWIVSLAISVACCAVLFVIFAGYLVDIKKNIALENDRLEQVALHEEQLLLEIRGLHHIVATTPATPGATTPVATTPVATTPVPTTPVVTPEATVTPAGAAANPQQVQVPGATAPTVPEVTPPTDAAAPAVPAVSVPVLTPKP